MFIIEYTCCISYHDCNRWDWLRYGYKHRVTDPFSSNSSVDLYLLVSTQNVNLEHKIKCSCFVLMHNYLNLKRCSCFCFSIFYFITTFWDWSLHYLLPRSPCISSSLSKQIFSHDFCTKYHYDYELLCQVTCQNNNNIWWNILYVIC